MEFNPVLLLECLEDDISRTNVTCDIKHFAIHALRNSIVKKFVAPGANSLLHEAALDNFLALNERIKNFRLSSEFASSGIFRTWKALLHDAFHSEELQSCSLTLSRCLDLGHCGPGASIDVKTTSFVEKMFSSPLACTSDHLVTYYRHHLSPRWARAEEIRSSAYGEKIVVGSRLSSVRKDRTKNRTTCKEPPLNLFYQLGAKEQIESVLVRRFGIQIETQEEINKSLARIASISGSHATLDLRNASDSNSLQLFGALLPRNVMDVLMQIRSPVTRVRKDVVPLYMIGTMGNGFTFPLMTLVFAALIKAVSIHHNIPCVNGVDFGVYGDDLIVRSEIVNDVISCLTQSGYEINSDKSFVDGPFRESCGGDYYRGHDVRGIYIQKVNHAGHVYSAFNRLHFWAIRHGVSLDRTLVYLKGLVDFRPVPMDSGVDEGFIVTTTQLTSPKRDRNGAIYYRSFRLVPPKGIRAEAFGFNPHGCLIAHLGGFIRDNRVACRYDSTDFAPSVVKRKTPLWDHSAHPGVTRRDLSVSWQVLLST